MKSVLATRTFDARILSLDAKSLRGHGRARLPSQVSPPQSSPFRRGPSDETPQTRIVQSFALFRQPGAFRFAILRGLADLARPVWPAVREIAILSQVVAAHCSWNCPAFLPAQPESAQEIATKESALRPGSSVVERGPEKAGVGGSIPSLATILFVSIL